MAKMNNLNKTVDIFNKDININELFCFNEFSEDIEYLKTPEWDSSIKKGKPIEDSDLIQIKYYVGSTHRIEPSKDIIADACFIVSKQRSYHPVKKYIQKEEWDGIPRLDEWLIKATGCEDNIYTRAVSSKFMIATINRIYNPGCKFDHMLILEGKQGIGKSTMIEILTDEWYLDTNFGQKDKDLIDTMRNAFMVEISELSGMNKKDVEWLKSFLSRKVDRVRLPYARKVKNFKRQCVFVGTYNPSGNNTYLRDDTGNRRFYPVECLNGFIDVKYLKENRHQIWAEAYKRYQDKEIYYINDPEAIAILSNIHSDRELETPTQTTIKAWLDEKELMGIYTVTMTQIIEECLKINTAGKMPRDLTGVCTVVGIIMKKLGWRKGNNENRQTYYSPLWKLGDEKKVEEQEQWS